MPKQKLLGDLMKNSFSVVTRAVVAIVIFFLGASALALETSTAVRAAVTDQAGNPLASPTATGSTVR